MHSSVWFRLFRNAIAGAKADWTTSLWRRHCSISNGCIRLQDAPRLAAWLFGAMPKGRDPDVEERVELPEAVPVFVTYLTVEATNDGIMFRADPYGRDPAVLARYFAEERQLAAASSH